MNQPSITPNPKGQEPDAISYLRAMSTTARQPSMDGVVNYDSLTFLAKFALGETSNLFHAVGAIRCSGATPQQLSNIIDLLEITTKEMISADDFPPLVEKRLGIRSATRQQFPAPSCELTEEERRRADESLQEQRARDQTFRQQAAADEQLDLAIAELLGVEVTKLEEAWGWARKDTGAEFSPVFDSAIALDLIERFRLDIRFAINNIVVTFFASRGSEEPHHIYASDHMRSLTRTVAEAAYRKATLESRLR
jgi:hypothetical protein